MAWSFAYVLQYVDDKKRRDICETCFKDEETIIADVSRHKCANAGGDEEIYNIECTNKDFEYDPLVNLHDRPQANATTDTDSVNKINLSDTR